MQHRPKPIPRPREMMSNRRRIQPRIDPAKQNFQLRRNHIGHSLAARIQKIISRRFSVRQTHSIVKITAMSRSPTPNLRPATNADREQVESLIFAVMKEYGLEPKPAAADKDLTDLDFHYHNRGGLFDVMEDAEGQIIGSIALYPIDTHCVELR